MPEMDGLTTAHEIHHMSLGEEPRLIMVTAFGREELNQLAKDAGIEEVLTKPVTASQLYNGVMHVFGNQRDNDTSQPSAKPSVDLSGIVGARILLVEDNELNQEVAHALLTGAGFEVDLADNGEVAIAMMQKSSYDLVFMDMQMPVMDGLEGYARNSSAAALCLCAHRGP